MWDHRPTADELLAKRLFLGWAPKPSLLKDGDVVEGHAACVVAAKAGAAPLTGAPCLRGGRSVG